MAQAFGETAPTCSEIRRSGDPIAAVSSCNYPAFAGISIERTQNATTAVSPVANGTRDEFPNFRGV